jgi:hypothetical protein
MLNQLNQLIMTNAKMHCRIEELPFLAGFTRKYFIRDRADFNAFSAVFNKGFLQSFETQTKQVKELLAPALLTAEMKAITKRIESHYITMRIIANKVERYAKMAKGTMNINPADFGFKNLRKELHLHNDEAVVKMLRELLQHIDTNRTALEANGLSQAYRQEMEMAINTFETDILEQDRKKNEREMLVKQNTRQFDTLWNMIAEIIDTGKAMYKANNKARVKDYTYYKLIKKVRLTRTKEEEQQIATQPVTGNPA